MSNHAAARGSQFSVGLACLLLLAPVLGLAGPKTAKPVLHGKHWVAITGKPLAATAGAMTFNRGGNAVDAACAMLAATATMWDVLGWGGETQALIYNPKTGESKVSTHWALHPLVPRPNSSETRAWFSRRSTAPWPPLRRAHPVALMVMLAEYGTMSLAEVLAPAMQMAEGYPMEEAQADNIERHKDILQQWPDSRSVFLPHLADDNAKQRVRALPRRDFSSA